MVVFNETMWLTGGETAGDQLERYSGKQRVESIYPELPIARIQLTRAPSEVDGSAFVTHHT